jgi:hypothetical protein
MALTYKQILMGRPAVDDPPPGLKDSAGGAAAWVSARCVPSPAPPLVPGWLTMATRCVAQVDILPRATNAERPSRLVSAHTLTKPVPRREAAVQAPERCDQEAQTDSRAAATPGRDPASPAQVAAFLGRAAPAMLAALQASAQPGGARRSGGRRQLPRYPQPQLIHCLGAFGAEVGRGSGSSAASSGATAGVGSGSGSGKLLVTALSWSCQGSTLAVAYGRWAAREAGGQGVRDEGGGREALCAARLVVCHVPGHCHASIRKKRK